MKRIVILIDQFYCTGGIERLVGVKANYWAEIFNYDVTIISTEQRGKPFSYELSHKVKFIDLAINYNREESYFKRSNFFKFLNNIFRLNKSLKNLKPDFVIVASHIPMTYFINFIKGKAKTVKEFHFTRYNEIQSWRHGIESYLLGKYEYLAVLSEEEKKFYTTNNIVIFPNPLINLDPIKRKTVNKKNIAIFLGRIAPVKNIEELVIIWGDFIKNNSEWVLEIYGDTSNNEYTEKLMETVAYLNLQEFILFKGEVKNTNEVISRSKLMLLTSHQECFPLVILESLSQGVPVYSYDCPTGPRNILTDGYDGRLIENKNRTQFVNALDVFANDDALRIKLSDNALITAEKYSLSNIMNLWNNQIFSK